MNSLNLENQGYNVMYYILRSEYDLLHFNGVNTGKSSLTVPSKAIMISS